MKLCQLFSIFSDYNLGEDPEVEVEGLTADSRSVQPGYVFVAVRGINSDGHQYLPQAVRQGAVALVVEDFSEIPSEFRGAWVQVPSSRRALGRIAEKFWQAPAEQLFLAAVTGTNGKTSTTYLMEQLLNHFGWPTGVMGTINHHLGKEVWPAALTTPDTAEFFERLGSFRDRGARAVAFEISSHSLHQRRVDLLDIDVAVFTNLSRDHLDYHGSMKEYLNAKSRLFSEILKHSKKPLKLALVNGDDPSCEEILHSLGGGVQVWRYGKGVHCELRYKVLSLTLEGSIFALATPQGSYEFKLPLIGEHNVSNAAAALGVGLFAGASLGGLSEALAVFPGVPGRLQRVPSKGSKAVFIDFAHTDEALTNTLNSVVQVRKPGQRLWTLFGCGGDRDPGKRPLMARAAAQFSDQLIITSDNPRSEDPEAIIRQILAGLKENERATAQVITDRRKAIHAAIEQMGAEDILVIAGKGHEEYQIIGTQKLPFSDYKAAWEKLNG